MSAQECLRKARSAAGQVLKQLGWYEPYERLVYRLRHRGEYVTITQGTLEVRIPVVEKSTAVAVRNFQRNEGEFVDWLLQEIRDGDVAWDIGANVGLVSLVLAKRLHPSGSVHAFEPEPRTFRILQRNIDANHSANLAAHRYAVGETDGTAHLFLSADPLYQDTHSFTRRTDVEHDAGLAVETIRADSVVEKGLAAPPSVLKIDVEGAEFGVLRGMGKILADPQLRTICIELHPNLVRLAKPAPDMLMDVLQPHGFRLVRTLPRGGEIHCLCVRG